MIGCIPMEWGKTETVHIPHWCDYDIHKIIEKYNLKWKNEPWINKFLDRKRLTKKYRSDFFNEVESYIKVNEVKRYTSDNKRMKKQNTTFTDSHSMTFTKRI